MNKQFDFRQVTIFSAVVLLAMFALSAYGWVQIPEGQLVPTHWGIDGQADQYGSKTVGLLMMPIVMSAIVALFLFIPKVEPRRSNLSDSQKAYKALWIIMMLFFAGLHTAIVFSTLGYMVDVIRLVGIGMGVLFMVTGNYMGKVQSNFVFGIRTPWTLTSEASWYKTHRAGGKLFFCVGLLFILLPFVVEASIAIVTVIGVMLAGVAVLTGYSYFVWKADPQAQQS